MLCFCMVKILVVRRDELFKEQYFEGFKQLAEHDFISFILDNHLYEERGEALENNPAYLQIIPYVWIVNPTRKEVFLYERGLGKGYQETRHVHRISGGVGGHIDYEEGVTNPILNSMMRELQEELLMDEYPQPEFIGYINVDKDMYNKVHFAIVGIAQTHHEIRPTDDGIASGKFYTIAQAEALFADPAYEVEAWNALSWPAIK